jgi:hypothetical protein
LSIVAFLPWLRLANRYEVAGVHFLPFRDADGRAFPEIRGAVRALGIILSSYRDRRGARLDNCVAVTLPQRLWRINEEDLETIVRPRLTPSFHVVRTGAYVSVQRLMTVSATYGCKRLFGRVPVSKGDPAFPVWMFGLPLRVAFTQRSQHRRVRPNENPENRVVANVNDVGCAVLLFDCHALVLAFVNEWSELSGRRRSGPSRTACYMRNHFGL